MFTMMIVVLGGAGLAAGDLGLFGFVAGARERDYLAVLGSLLALAAGAGFGWMAIQVGSVNDAITTSRVDRVRAVKCTAEILNAKDERVRINETDVYRFRVRVQIPSPAPPPSAPATSPRSSRPRPPTPGSRPRSCSSWPHTRCAPGSPPPPASTKPASGACSATPGP
ncbi:hypothetical protein [Actinomadura kijaniata]|uniref:hypothetical protein n=1 Tax=Actinomadura kijaniata TaxID=46161 RepID=UPI000AB33B99|nr:hypothetical protein [Actinomadura kijaniata]